MGKTSGPGSDNSDWSLNKTSSVGDHELAPSQEMIAVMALWRIVGPGSDPRVAKNLSFAMSVT